MSERVKKFQVTIIEEVKEEEEEEVKEEEEEEEEDPPSVVQLSKGSNLYSAFGVRIAVLKVAAIFFHPWICSHSGVPVTPLRDTREEFLAFSTPTIVRECPSCWR